MKSINDLQATGAAQRRAAHALADAAQELARTANGVQESVMPGPRRLQPSRRHQSHGRVSA